MTPMDAALTTLAADLVRLDSRSPLSNVAVAERIEAELTGFDVERLDYVDVAGTPKRALVAHRGVMGGVAFSGHMDTVPDTGWQTDPWSGRVVDGMLHGLGSTDMKGPVAACVMAARAVPDGVPVTLLLTTDEETTKAGAKRIAAASELVRRVRPVAIVVAEPTGMVPVRGHRSSILWTATATGVQAHSSSRHGRNANWALVPFLAEMKALHERLRDDPALHDAAYEPPFSDFNMVVDNHGAAVNVTVPVATARIKFRRSARLDAAAIETGVREAAARAGLALVELREGPPPELPADHPLIRLCVEIAGAAAQTAAYGTDASELQSIAPCVIVGPGDIAVAHRPAEAVRLADLAAAVPLFVRIAERVAAQA